MSLNSIDKQIENYLMEKRFLMGLKIAMELAKVKNLRLTLILLHLLVFLKPNYT